MSGPQRLLLLAELVLIAFLVARARGLATAGPGRLPRQDGQLAALAVALPGLALLVTAAMLVPAWVTAAVLRDAAALPAEPFARAATLAGARDGVGPLAPAYAHWQTRLDWGATVLLLLVAAAGWAWSRRYTRTRPAGAAAERVVVAGLSLASTAAVIVTAGIVLTLLWESLRFFADVSPLDFLLGTHWSPQAIDAGPPGERLGAVPLFWGTLLIGGVIAMAVAVPLGLGSAIYLAHYAAPRTRRWLKPLLEVLAGIPTVVYGFLAALVVAPAVLRAGVAIGDPAASGESALAAGLVIGVMLIPQISSAGDDALAAVPPELSEASLALGATDGETLWRVLLPAAMPGIAAGVLLAFSRALGETMIVVMAASAVATLTLDPLAPATTVTRQIVDLLTGEAAFDSPRALAAFALGLTLFVVTLLLNLLALRTLRRWRAAHG